jgi:hypothetical protein
MIITFCLSRFVSLTLSFSVPELNWRSRSFRSRPFFFSLHLLEAMARPNLFASFRYRENINLFGKPKNDVEMRILRTAAL